MEIDNTFLASLIGGASVIIAPVVTLLVKKKYDEKQLPTNSPERRKVLSGTWNGTSTQLVGMDEYKVPAKVQIEIKTHKKTITGHVLVDYEDRTNNVKGKLESGFFDGRVFRINYKNEKSDVMQHGSLFFEVKPDGVAMEGGFIGFGYKSERVVFGEIKLEKRT